MCTSKVGISLCICQFDEFLFFAGRIVNCWTNEREDLNAGLRFWSYTYCVDLMTETELAVVCVLYTVNLNFYFIKNYMYVQPPSSQCKRTVSALLLKE